MTGEELHRRLSEPFAAADVEWRVTKLRNQSSEGLVVPFIDSRAIQNRLDDVVGPFFWRTRFIPWHQYVPKPGKYEDPNEVQKTPVSSQLCGLSIYNGERKEWVEKVDGAENTDIEAIKGGISSYDLKDLKCQVELCNTYHLHLRPGDHIVRQMGGLHKFMDWDGPILTDSGGFQVFSLASLRKIREEGVTFASHIDGHRIFMGPEESMRIQSNLGSDIAMAFDECVENPATYEYAKASCERTARWLERCKAEHDRLNSLPDTVNPGQMLFGINQGATFPDLRVWHMKEIAKLDCDGYAIGGLAVGEPTEVMYEIIDAVEPHMPQDKPRYLMGVGTPSNIIEAVARGVDFFDCVMPSRNGRHGKLFTWEGTVNILNEKYATDPRPISESCGCPACRSFSRAYIRHLFKADEVLALRLAVLHNLWFYNELAACIRQALDEGTFADFRARYSGNLEKRA